MLAYDFQLVPWVTTALAVGYVILLHLKSAKNSSKDGGKFNKLVQLDNSKVVHTLDIEDLDKKSVLCRCWKSSKFPYCDGSHNKHNETTGDNLGPIIIQKK